MTILFFPFWACFILQSYRNHTEGETCPKQLSWMNCLMNITYFLSFEPPLEPGDNWTLWSLVTLVQRLSTLFSPGFPRSCSGGRDAGGWSQEMKGGIVFMSSCTLATWPRCFWWVEIHNGHLRATYSSVSWGSGSRRTRGPAALLKCDPPYEGVWVLDIGQGQRKWVQGKSHSAEINSWEPMLVFRNSVI